MGLIALMDRMDRLTPIVFQNFLRMNNVPLFRTF